MSYTYLIDHCENSTSLPAVEGAYSAASFSDIPASVLSRLNLTDANHCCSGSETESFLDSQSGMMSGHSMATPGVEKLTQYAAASPAKEFPPQEMEQGLTMKKADYGVNKQESLARFDPASHSLKTHQCSLLEAGFESLLTLPKWGTIVAGELYPLPMPSGLLELRAWITSALESGSWQRMETPTTQDGCDRQPSQNFTMTKTGRARHLNKDGVESQERLCQQVKRLPTPTVDGNYNRKGASATSGDGLATVVKAMRVPTPKASESGPDLAKLERSSTGISLPTWVRLSGSARVPTPTVQDSKNNCGPSQKERDALNVTVGGPLNPEWVEWLMGWPIGWTGLGPLETAKFQQWLNSHGKP